ncbi:MAG: hypothetical protein R2825_12895 [Saprospiraceae bacterium]
MKKEMEKPSSPLLYEVRCADQLTTAMYSFCRVLLPVQYKETGSGLIPITN